MDVEALILKGESQALEFKERFDSEGIETATAFANAGGGVVLIGVSDKGTVVGTKIGKETLKDWANKISQSTEPTIMPLIESHVVSGKTVVIITIDESPLKPVAYKGLCFMRQNNSNKKLTPKEVFRMHLQTIGSSWDSYPARDAAIEDIDIIKVKKYIILANETGRRKIREAPMAVLRKLDLVKDEGPTWAAILLFGKEPQRFVIQAKVHCGRFKISKIDILDDRMIEGNLAEQADEAMDFIKKHISVRFKITGKPRREEIWEYPLEALREGVINAIVHRDYTESSDVMIEIYDEKIEIWNPGNLPLGISIKDLYQEDHKSIPRNKLVAQVFYDAGLVEKYGSGTTRMLSLCKAAGIFLEFRESFGGFSTIFRKDIYTGQYLRKSGFNERQVKAVMYVKEKGRITNKEYRKITGLSDEGVRKDIGGLVEKNVFQPEGMGRSTHYILIVGD